MKYFVLAGAFAGFSISTKYNSFLIVLSLIIAYFYANKKIKLDKKFVILLLVTILAFFIGTPYSILDFLNNLGEEI